MRETQLQLEPFLKPKELAAIINVTPECVRSWIYHGRIPVRRFGRAVRIPREVALRIVEGGLENALQRQEVLAE